MRGELELKDKEIENLNFEVKNAGDNYSYLAKETAQLQKDYHHYKSSFEGLARVKSDLEGEILKLDDKINNYRIELLTKDDAIATLKSELEAGRGKQLNLFPGQEPTPIPTPEPEPEPEQLQPAPKVRGKGKTQKLPAVDKVKTESEPVGTNGTKLLNAKQLAERINTTYSPKKPVNDHNLRDWYKSDSTCSDSYRAEKESLYHYRFSHQDAKKAYWFELLPE